MRFLVLFLLLAAVPAFADSYTVTTDSPREIALRAEAARMGLTPAQALQFFIDNLLDRKAVEIRDNRISGLVNGWERLTPDEKKTVEGLVDRVRKLE
jgi:hypothetical protein